ncbi:MAG: hypothetical protein DIU80_020665 [Chloroflexota bacterium]
MDPVTYLMTPAAGVGALEWVFFVAQVLVTITGIYLAFMSGDTHPVRGQALRRLGYALLAVGLVGAVIGALRISDVAPFTMPIWITVATLFNLALFVFALYYARTVYPEQLRAYEQESRGRAARQARPQVASTPDAARAAARTPARSDATPRSSAATQSPPSANGAARAAGSSRRLSRRERKRRNR